MGGGSYDRDVYSSSSSSGWGSTYNPAANSALSASSLVSEMHPLNKIIESTSKSPIVLMLDVTGSNTNFAKTIYRKAPMFYGQIEQQGYLKDFDIAICAVGDAHGDDYPLQVAEFSKGIEIDAWLKKLVLEEGGGGQRKESYELAAYYMLHNTKFADDAEPILIFLGDESPYPNVNLGQIREYVNSDAREGAETGKVFAELVKKFKSNVYFFLNPYSGATNDPTIRKDWKDTLPRTDREHVIFMEPNNEEAIVDLMLGVIAISFGARSLDSYKVDMLDRFQDAKRISAVSSMLDGFSTSLVPIANVAGMNSLVPTNKAAAGQKKGTRL